MEFEYISWERFDKGCDDIASRIKSKIDGGWWRISNIYGVPRGGLVVAVKLSHLLNLPIITDKDKIIPSKTIIVDDIVDTAGTLTETVKALKENGAKRVFAVCTHGIFSGQAIERITSSLVDKIYISDTIPQSEEKLKSRKS